MLSLIFLFEHPTRLHTAHVSMNLLLNNLDSCIKKFLFRDRDVKIVVSQKSVRLGIYTWQFLRPREALRVKP